MIRTSFPMFLCDLVSQTVFNELLVTDSISLTPARWNLQAKAEHVYPDRAIISDMG